jgi:Fur family peroxide stress response transcriptional regulator
MLSILAQKGGNDMNIAELLRSNGYKVTPQRLAVYDAIDHNMTHPNAESIYQQLQPQYPSMSLATVYKTMEIFAKIGVVKILQCGEDAHRYDYNTSQHAHIRCVKCNRVLDVDIDEGQLAQQAEAQTGFSVSGVSLSFLGVCKDCQEAE